MTDVDKLLHELSSIAQSDAPPTIDVCDRVMQTVSAQPQRTPLDSVPLAFAGATVAVAAIVLIALLPAWQAMFEPWVAYLP